MPNTTTMRYLLAGILSLTGLFIGCNSQNSQSILNPDTGKHPTGWLPAAHVAAARSDIDTCATCHGSDLTGGISRVSCTSCHIGSSTTIHPSSWVPIYSTHGPYAKANTAAACANQYCHGPSLSGVAGSGPSCTSCHLGGPTSIHPADWAPVYTTHGAYVTANSTTSCANQYCHGPSLSGVAGSGPSCTSCHLGGPTSVHPADWTPIYTTHGPYVNANSTSACANQYCHGLSLTGVVGSGPSCTSCHLGGITSGHPADWVPVYSSHGPYVTANGTSACANESCHGPSLSGVAGSGPSCTLCHMGSPTSVHPVDWTPVYAAHGPYVTANGTNACANEYCHGPQLSGVAGSGPSCTSCHMGGTTSIHPAAWLGDACSNHGNYAITNGTVGCSNAACHGADLGGVAGSGPSCTKCHTTIPTSSSCSSCHGIPPAGTAYPDTAGKHAIHMELSGVTCATCHNRSCDQHANGTVDVIFDPAYGAETGIASLGTGTGITCANISCHGGPRSQRIRTTSTSFTQVTSATTWTSDPAQTPDWYGTAGINLNDTTQCTSCHAYGNTLYNGYFSGQHYYHVVVEGLACTACHDTLKLTSFSFHFPDLSSRVISTATASASLNSWLNFNGATCASSQCHADTRSWW